MQRPGGDVSNSGMLNKNTSYSADVDSGMLLFLPCFYLYLFYIFRAEKIFTLIILLLITL